MTETQRDISYFTIGLLGALITLYGNIIHIHPQLFYIIGAIALIVTAIHFELMYFVALELILVAGHSTAWIGFGLPTQIALPLLLCLQLFIFYLMLGKENKLFLLIGIIGIALISLGFSYHNQWIFFFGSLCIVSYSCYNGYIGRYPAYLWAVLNGIFALSAFYKIMYV